MVVGLVVGMLWFIDVWVLSLVIGGWEGRYALKFGKLTRDSAAVVEG